MPASGGEFWLPAVCESEEMGTTTGSAGDILICAIPAGCRISLGVQSELGVHLPMLWHEDATMYVAPVTPNLECFVPTPSATHPCNATMTPFP